MSKRYVEMKELGTCLTSETEFITRCDVCDRYIVIDKVDDLISEGEDGHYDYYEYECLCGEKILIRD